MATDRQGPRGLSPQEFVAQIKASDNIALNWPFGQRRNVTQDTSPKAMVSSDLVHFVNRHIPVIGIVRLTKEGVALDIREPVGEFDYTPHALLPLTMEDTDQRAWRQMVGVRIAAEVAIEVTSQKVLRAEVLYISDIESPLTRRGKVQKGFIQGKVFRDPPLVVLGGNGRKTNLISYAKLELVTVEGEPQQKLRRGTSIRARVARTFFPNEFKQTENQIYILSKN